MANNGRNRICALIWLILFASIFLLGCSRSDNSNKYANNIQYSGIQQTRNGTPDTPEEVWGELEQHEGERVWNTLTSEQRALVHYPRFESGKVYWTPNGFSYHSIDWCYTLSRSDTIRIGTLEEARKAGKTDPCSKCVGDP